MSKKNVANTKHLVLADQDLLTLLLPGFADHTLVMNLHLRDCAELSYSRQYFLTKTRDRTKNIQKHTTFDMKKYFFH